MSDIALLTQKIKHFRDERDADYVGVIIGPDMVYRDGRVVTDAAARAGSDKSIHGWRKLLQEDAEGGAQRLDAIIKNTYRTLMTRGMKGCYVYCVDRELGEMMKNCFKNESSV